MWKKTGNVQPGSSRFARSHLTKHEEPFQPFHNRHLSLPKEPHPHSPLANFCEAYINRHHSADKPHPSHSRTRSEHSSLAPTQSAHPTPPHPSHDLFSLMRTHQQLKRKPSLEGQIAVPTPDYSLLGVEQQLKMYRNKWREASNKITALKKQQAELKTHLTSELNKCKQAVEGAVAQLKSHVTTRRDSVVMGALQAARSFRGEQEKWRLQRQGILQRFNKSIEQLI